MHRITTLVKFIKIFLLLASIAALSTPAIAAENCTQKPNFCFGIDWKKATVDDVSNIDVTVRDRGGFTPLHWAAAHSNLDVVRALLEAGANVNAKGSFLKITPLYNALFNRNAVHIVKILLHAEADANVRDIGGLTPLDWELTNNQNPEVIKALERATK